MIAKQFTSLGLKYTVPVPESYAEYDALDPKRQHACLDEGIEHIIQHSTNGDFRYLFVEALEKATGVGRLKIPTGETEKDDAGVETPITVLEKELVYKNRVFATKGWTDATPEVQSLIKQVESAKEKDGKLALRFDPSGAVRTSAGPKKLPEIYANAAAVMIQKGTTKKWLKVFKSELGLDIVLTGDKVKDIDLIGRAIQARVNKQREAAAKEYTE